jgi:hypothetical protein
MLTVPFYHVLLHFDQVAKAANPEKLSHVAGGSFV